MAFCQPSLGEHPHSLPLATAISRVPTPRVWRCHLISPCVSGVSHPELDSYPCLDRVCHLIHAPGWLSMQSKKILIFNILAWDIVALALKYIYDIRLCSDFPCKPAFSCSSCLHTTFSLSRPLYNHSFLILFPVFNFLLLKSTSQWLWHFKLIFLLWTASLNTRIP